MRSLIVKDLIVSGVKVKQVLIFFSIVLLVFLCLPLDDYIGVFAYGLIIVAPLIFFFGIENYTDKDDFKTELMFPIKKQIIVVAKYAEYFLLTSISVLTIAILLILKSFVRGYAFKEYYLNVIGVGVGMSILYGSVFLLLIFVFGQKRIKEAALVAFVLSIIPSRLYMEIIKFVVKMDNVFHIYNYTYYILMFIAFSVLIFVTSCFISIIAFDKKEF